MPKVKDRKIAGGVPKWAAGLIWICLLGGCSSSEPPADPRINRAVADLQAQRFDQALAESDAVLASHPSDASAAAGYYVRGRIFADRPKADANAKIHDLTEARLAFTRALDAKPYPRLEGRIRAALGYVAFLEDDYTTSALQLSSAYDLLDDPIDRSKALYYMALSQQRLGRFTDADQTFARVEQLYGDVAGAPVAAAREHEGASGFFVQLGSFAQSGDADRAAVAAGGTGFGVQKSTDRRGLTVVRAGPVENYAQAKVLQSALAAQYADSIIVP